MNVHALPTWAKSWGGAIVAGLLTAGTAASDGHITLAEGLGIAAVFVGTAIGVYAIPNSAE